MRRPAVLALSLFAIAASLPAEVRECLPRTAACATAKAHAVAGASCARPAKARSCGRAVPAGCPKTRPTPDAGRCRLHPTPPIVRRAAAVAAAAPLVPVLLLPVDPIEAPQLSRRGWREEPTLRPRASPADAPRSPRPPPFAV